MEQGNVYIDILRGAQKELRRGWVNGICAGISLVGGLWDEVIEDCGKSDAARELKAWVKGMLGEHVYLEGWLLANVPTYRDSPNKVRRTRIAWIDWMIEQIRNNGGRIPQ